MDLTLQKRQSELSAAYSAFCQILDRIDDAKHDQAGVCGAWSPQDVVAHLIGWDKSMEEFIADPERFDPTSLLDFDRFNARSVSERAQQSWQETLDELQREHARLHAAIATVSTESKIFDRVCEWLAGRTNDYEHHTAQLRGWIA